MYFKDLETSAQAKRDHDKRQKENAAARLAKNAEIRRKQKANK